MPDFMVSPFDNLPAKPDPVPATDPSAMSGSIALPATGREAILRGLRARCPRCGDSRLFPRFLKPVARCSRCGQDWTHQQADDFPAHVSILVTGHLMAPLIIALTRDTQLSVTWLVAIIMPLALIRFNPPRVPSSACSGGSACMGSRRSGPAWPTLNPRLDDHRIDFGYCLPGNSTASSDQRPPPLMINGTSSPAQLRCVGQASG